MSAAEGGWVSEAIAQQEEYLKRRRACQDIPLRPHSFDQFSVAPGAPTYRACFRCKVTETDADYQTLVAHR